MNVSDEQVARIVRGRGTEYRVPCERGALNRWCQAIGRPYLGGAEAANYEAVRRAFANGHANEPDQVQDSEDEDSEFVICDSFCVANVASCVRAGAFPMAIDASRNCSVMVFAMKLHRRRTIVVLRRARDAVSRVLELADGAAPPEFHVSRSNRRRCRRPRYSVTFCRQFDRICALKILEKGYNWLCPPLIRAFKALGGGGDGGAGGPRCVSCEVWDNESGELVAGELGLISVPGAVYCSLTGWCSRAPEHSGAGAVQLACLGQQLTRAGFAVWDLGMAMPYKLDLGGIEVARERWLSLFDFCHERLAATASEDWFSPERTQQSKAFFPSC